MTLSEKKVMASHCAKDGEKMEQRPSPVLAERKRTLELSPCSSLHAQHPADKRSHCDISALTSILVRQLSLQMPSRDALGATKVLLCDLPHSSEGSWDICLIFKILWGATSTNHRREKKNRETTCPDSALQARLPSVWLCRAPSGLPSWEESKVTDKGICQTGRTSLDKKIVCYGDNKAQIIVKLHQRDSCICFPERFGGGKREASGFTLGYSICRLQMVKFGMGWVWFAFAFNLQRP